MPESRDITKEEAINLLRGPYGKEMKNMVSSYVAPIFWQELKKEGGIRLRNGTMFFMNAGEGQFAVTARHVYQGYREAKSNFPESVCQLSNLPFDLEDRLISLIKPDWHGPDIATFRIESEEVKKLGKAVLTGSQKTWPPTPPQQCKGVYFAGYPGRELIQNAPDKINFGIKRNLLTATSVSDLNISCQIEKDYLVENSPPVDYDARGISGAPLLSLVDDRLWSWRLAGVIFQDGYDLGILKAARADFIRPDGSVRRYDVIQRVRPLI